MPSGFRDGLLKFCTLCLVCILSTACATRSPADAEPVCTIEPGQEPVICTMEYAPVCGCNGVTYSNACQAGGAGVSSTRPGSCDGKELR